MTRVAGSQCLVSQVRAKPHIPGCRLAWGLSYQTIGVVELSDQQNTAPRPYLDLNLRHHQAPPGSMAEIFEAHKADRTTDTLSGIQTP
ncbi:RGD1562146 (predicted) [Rattus norvegicus]|uniref:RGD1562146 (Predicted) n=1 Tax=Rattus norvegicus TaxID=10116 RepID=A6H9F8_RAT|nr:RGD1562146 (predicted) [Rattus norvegicus]